MTNIPDTLFKYRDWELPFHRRILTHNELFLSSADLFNDPFDAALPFRYEKKLLTKDNIIKKLVEVAKIDYPKVPDIELEKIALQRYNSVDLHSDAYWKGAEERIRQHIKKTFGICSLTSKNDNLLMWSHYGNSHSGFCIGLDKFEIFHAVLGMFKKINYADKFPIIPMFGSGDLDMIELIMTKSLHWQYEDEYRITKVGSVNQIFKFSDSAIKEIVLGCKITPNNRNDIILMARSKTSKIKIYDSVIDDSDFKVNLVEVS